MKNFILFLIAVVVVAGAWLMFRKPVSTPIVVNVETPTNTSNPTATSTTPSKTDDLIVIDLPKINSTTTSPIALSGKARGNWFFEASAPVFVKDSKGNTLGQGYIQATGEWMTTEFVPFTGSVTFTKPAGTSTDIYLIFMNDNPSGDPERSLSVNVPLKLQR